MSKMNLVLGTIAAAYCITVGLFDIDLAQSENLTRLRASTPKGTFENYKGATRLTRVDLQVRNVGEEKAVGVSVQITLPDGSTKQARGPAELEPKAEGSYELYYGEYVTSSKSLKASTSCSNCYR